MSNKKSPGIVVVTKFVDKDTASNKGKSVKKFADYINYLDRIEAVRNEHMEKYNLFSTYADGYMNNPHKTGALFNNESDVMIQEEVANLKSVFDTAYKNNGIMWQTVVSFDNLFLAKTGIYDQRTGVLDERVMHSAIRRMMANALEKEGMSHTAVWSAAIHYNTDNIHVHIAYTEPYNTRPIKVVDGEAVPKGYFSAKTLRNMKSNVVNYFLNNNYTKVDELVRDRFIASKKAIPTYEDELLKTLWFKVYDNLPEDRRTWYYNMNEMKHVRGALDELTTKYIRTYHPEEYAEFQRLLYEKDEVYRMAYGDNGKPNQYIKGKTQDLYKRMGNAVLSEMRRYSYSPYAAYSTSNRGIGAPGSYILGRIKSSLSATMYEDDKRNEQEYYELMAQIQYGD